MQASQEHLVSHVLPLLVRAYDDNDARMQEEGLKRTVSLSKQLDVQVIIYNIMLRKASSSSFYLIDLAF